MKPVTVAIIATKYHPVTSLCLESVFKHKKDEKVALICNGQPTNEARLVMENWIVELLNKYKVDAFSLITDSSVASAYNKAIEISGEGDLVIMQNDVIVTPNWLEPLQKLAYSHKDIGMVAPFTFPQWPMNHKPFSSSFMDYLETMAKRYWDVRQRLFCNMPSTELLEQVLKNLFGDLDKFAETFCEIYKDTLPYDDASMMAMYLKRDAINRIGMWDEDFYPWNGEEYDYRVRMNNAGLFRLTCFQSFIFHWTSITTRQQIDESTEIFKAGLAQGDKIMNKWAIDEEGGKCHIPTQEPKRRYNKFKLRTNEAPIDGRNFMIHVPLNNEWWICKG